MNNPTRKAPRFPPASMAAMEAEPAPLARLLLLTIALFLGLALVWASLGTVEQVANASGHVRPFGRVKIVNHPEGGRITAIHVREGEAVERGQPLLALDASALNEEIAHLTDRWQNLAVEIARLEAEAAGTAPAFDPAFDPAIAEARADLVRLHTRLFDSHLNALESEKEIAERIVEQRYSDAEGLTRKVEEHKGSLAILKKQERSVGALADKGYFPELRYLSMQRQRAEAEGALAKTQEELIAAFAALAEARERRKTLDRKWQADTLDRLAAAKREHDQTFGALTQLQTRRKALVIAAPSAGIVQNLQITSVGQAIGKNEPLMNLVPTADRLIVEARVQNRDIGYVSVGQKARIKFRTYDFLRFGSLDGTVEQVAANALNPPGGGASYFPVVIRTSRDYLGSLPEERPVQPGMAVDVDLRIGEKSVLSYLTDRIFRTRAGAFQER